MDNKWDENLFLVSSNELKHSSVLNSSFETNVQIKVNVFLIVAEATKKIGKFLIFLSTILSIKFLLFLVRVNMLPVLVFFSVLFVTTRSSRPFRSAEYHCTGSRYIFSSTRLRTRNEQFSYHCACRMRVKFLSPNIFSSLFFLIASHVA